MAIHHASSGELVSVRPFDQNLEDAISMALFKSEHLEVFRTVLLAGQEMPAHQVPGECTIQCLEGIVMFTASGNCQLMRGGDLICLEGGVIHAIRAVEDASILVTLLRHVCRP